MTVRIEELAAGSDYLPYTYEISLSAIASMGLLKDNIYNAKSKIIYKSTNFKTVYFLF